MNKLAFWMMMFIGLMLCFLKYEIGSFVAIEKPYMAIMKFGPWPDCIYHPHIRHPERVYTGP